LLAVLLAVALSGQKAILALWWEEICESKYFVRSLSLSGASQLKFQNPRFLKKNFKVF